MNTFEIDIIINTFFQENYTEFGREFFIIIAEIGDKYGVAILALIFGIFFFRKNYYNKLITLFTTMFLGVSSSIAIKYLVARERPENMIMEYGGYSFPSGHSVFAILFYGLLVYLFWDIIKNKILKYFILVFAIIMGILVMISRLYLSVHYFSDVITGFIIGLFWLIFGIFLYNKLEKR
ncbi:MAG: phosphatase PAP2 family protein [Candidatus Gracilibacteria bacterium]|nr:phosphatase PAP2 family protein [Candidatus Gracilibacteria bacterium]MDQ7023237.1 phosphatase PAP2 family protein [Candidatus Gracilibacteria bacterium]